MLSLVAIRNHVPLVQKYRHEFDVRFSARRSLLSCFRVVNALFYSRLSSTSTLPILKRLHGGGVAKNKTPPSCAAVSVCLSVFRRLKPCATELNSQTTPEKRVRIQRPCRFPI